MNPSPLLPARRLLADVAQYVLRRPPGPTRIRPMSEADREAQQRRILQRLGISVEKYAVLDVHRIGIAASVDTVWAELLEWRPDAGYWPDALAHVVTRLPARDHADVYLFGRTTSLFGLRNGFLGLDFIPLFSLDLIRRQSEPLQGNADDARFAVYRCRNGYPVGVFAIYVRPGIPADGEAEPAQMFFLVSFDFFGRQDGLAPRVLQPVWTFLHDRVTGHFLHRFKDRCEQRAKRLNGEGVRPLGAG